jgi:hypothetical protein
MTLEGFRDPLPMSDAADRARSEIDNLFARPQPAVTVVVKKRRWAGTATRGSDDLAADTSMTPPTAHDAAGAHAPRVHRLATAVPGRHDPGEQRSEQSGKQCGKPCGDPPRGAAAQTAPVGPAADVAPAASSGSPRRRRAARNPARRPSPVRIVMQAPPKPAVAEVQPAWQRILCVAPPPVSYRQVLQTLEEVQVLLAQAKQAGTLRFDTSGG